MKLVSGIWRHQLQPHHKMLGNQLARMWQVRQVYVYAAAAADGLVRNFCNFSKSKIALDCV